MAVVLALVMFLLQRVTSFRSRRLEIVDLLRQNQTAEELLVGDEEPPELQFFGPRGVASVSISREGTRERPLQEEQWYVGECVAAPEVGAFRLAGVTEGEDEGDIKPMAKVAAFPTAAECATGTFWPASKEFVFDIPIDGIPHLVDIPYTSKIRATISLVNALQASKKPPARSCHDFDGDIGGSCLGCVSYTGGVKTGLFSKTDYKCSWDKIARKCAMRHPSLSAARTGTNWASGYHHCPVDDTWTKYHGKQISLRAKAWLTEIANRHRHSKLKMVSGTHSIDEERAREWKELQCSELNKKRADFILANTHYYSFDKFYEAIKRQFKKFLVKIKERTGTYKWILLLHTANKDPESPGKWKKKSNFWVGQLLAQIALEGAALPGGLLGEDSGPGEDPYLPIDVAKSIGDSPFPANANINYLIVDDAMYTGKQLLEDIGWHTGPNSEKWTSGFKQVYSMQDLRDTTNYFKVNLGDYSYFVNVLAPFASKAAVERITGTWQFPKNENAGRYSLRFSCSNSDRPCFEKGETFFYEGLLPEWLSSNNTEESNARKGINQMFNGRRHFYTRNNKLVYFDHKIPDYVSSMPRAYALGVITPNDNQEAPESHKHCREKPPKGIYNWKHGCSLGVECNKLFSYPFVKGCFSDGQGVTNPGDNVYWQNLVDLRWGGNCMLAFYKEWES